jgi:hypothetical protein
MPFVSGMQAKSLVSIDKAPWGHYNKSKFKEINKCRGPVDGERTL